ncbi:hypothetical protein EYF80_044931 [Liparis tanakae]|uniref:Uncharacterized protein n=1 Tax=Liparis tanakae TaxID=230148 RepID=A0A4Z2FV43_9TELE|nr:hypothetical protein EYF80_044931 [Liparis tanakae]
MPAYRPRVKVSRPDLLQRTQYDQDPHHSGVTEAIAGRCRSAVEGQTQSLQAEGTASGNSVKVMPRSLMARLTTKNSAGFRDDFFL